ncbi:MAG: NAD(+)/NADH kinase [Syntrophomonadaceae bacterium]|nr:NAD(+)/NADH kinase [Syntrophomonadaceae bacterium]
MKKVGMVLNNKKSQIRTFSQSVAAILRGKNIETWFEHEPWCNTANTDLILVLGGDGTVLRAFREFGTLEVPFFCVNFGNIGFLSAIEPDDINEYLPSILEGKYSIEERTVIQISVIREETEEILCSYALNDVVIRSPQPKISRQLLKIDGNIFAKYEGDGIICATPTGSTAYSLSAGGAIVDPQMEAIIITPICSRLNMTKSMVLNAKHKLEIINKDRSPHSLLVIDGVQHSYLLNDDVIKIEKAALKAKLVQVKKNRYYHLLHSRLRD